VPRPQPRPTPKPVPQPNPGTPQPKPGDPKETPNEPKDKAELKNIEWREIEPLKELDPKVIKETDFFGHFKFTDSGCDIEDLKDEKKGIVIFFYAPDDVEGKKAEKMKELTEKLSELFEADEVRAFADKFNWLKCDVTKVEKPLLRKYGLSGFPAVLLIDIKGLHFWHSAGSVKPKYLKKKLKLLDERCERLRKKEDEE